MLNSFDHGQAQQDVGPDLYSSCFDTLFWFLKEWKCVTDLLDISTLINTKKLNCFKVAKHIQLYLMVIFDFGKYFILHPNQYYYYHVQLHENDQNTCSWIIA